MHVRAVAFPHDGVAERRLHAALGCGGVGTPGRDKGQANSAESGFSSGNGHAFARESGAYAQEIGLKNLHVVLRK
jgi:hypothetical protein